MAAKAVVRPAAAAAAVAAAGRVDARLQEVMRKDDGMIVQTYARQKVAFTHGKGVHLYDTAGKQYLDFYSGVAVTALGHADPELTQAVADQASKLTHISNLFYNEIASRLAERIVRTSFAKRIFFCNSGAEAAEGAIKFARKWGKDVDPSGQKHRLVSFKGGFHGRSMGALSCTANPKYQKPFTPLLPGVDHVAVGDIAGLREVMSDATCGVIIEPIQGEGGVNVVPTEFLAEIRRLCDQHRALLIFDEVQCGLARTGKLWAHEWTGVTPDVMTLAKALGNGIPIGAICATEQVGQVFHPGDHGSTFAGQPLACRAGEVVFDRISQPAFMANVAKMGDLLRSGLAQLRSPYIKEIRGRGLIAGVQVDLQGLGLQDVNPILGRAREHGLLAINAGSDVIRLLPPLTIQADHVAQAVHILGKALS